MIKELNRKIVAASVALVLAFVGVFCMGNARSYADVLGRTGVNLTSLSQIEEYVSIEKNQYRLSLPSNAVVDSELLRCAENNIKGINESVANEHLFINADHTVLFPIDITAPTNPGSNVSAAGNDFIVRHGGSDNWVEIHISQGSLAAGSAAAIVRIASQVANAIGLGVVAAVAQNFLTAVFTNLIKSQVFKSGVWINLNSWPGCQNAPNALFRWVCDVATITVESWGWQ